MRKVLVVAHEVGLESEIERVSVNPFAAPGDLPRDNPLGKVPALVRDDGSVLFDSPVIAAYLNAQRPPSRASLLPAEGEPRWAALRLEALADGIMDAAVLLRLELLRQPPERSSSWMDRQRAAIVRSLDVLEQDGWSSGPLNIGQIAVACALGYLDLRHAALAWREGRPRLTAWHAAIEERPSLRATAHPA